MNISPTQFRVALSADFRDDEKRLIFPDIGLSLLDGIPGLSHDFLPDYRPEYGPDQLSGCDVVISLKPRVRPTRWRAWNDSVRSAAVVWGMTTWISMHAPLTMSRSSSHRMQSCGPLRNRSYSWCWLSPTTWF